MRVGVVACLRSGGWVGVNTSNGPALGVRLVLTVHSPQKKCPSITEVTCKYMPDRLLCTHKRPKLVTMQATT